MIELPTCKLAAKNNMPKSPKIRIAKILFFSAGGCFKVINRTIKNIKIVKEISRGLMISGNRNGRPKSSPINNKIKYKKFLSDKPGIKLSVNSFSFGARTA